MFKLLWGYSRNNFCFDGAPVESTATLSARLKSDSYKFNCNSPSLCSIRTWSLKAFNGLCNFYIIFVNDSLCAILFWI